MVNSYTVQSDDSERWSSAEAHTDDGKLTILGHPVMQQWEDTFMLELARAAAKSGGTVLEVGFGMGIASGHLAALGVDEHVVVEANRDVYLHLLDFAARSAHRVIPIFGSWKTVLPVLAEAHFDGILYDTYPNSHDEMHTHQFDFAQGAIRTLRPGGVLTYCNLTSWGNLRTEYDCDVMFNKTQAPYLRSAGFSDIGCEVVAVDPPEDCAYYSFKEAIVPFAIKGM